MSATRHSRLKRLAGRLLLVLVSSVLTYAVLEFLALGFLLGVLPVKAHWYLDDGTAILAQYSKGGIVPERYVACMGDSFAAGSGDWYKSASKNGRPDYHAAHVIHNMTGRDVITLGVVGAGSLHGLAGESLARYEYLKASRRFEFDPPEIIVAYFYEGNDLDNNIIDLRRRYKRDLQVEKIRDPAYFAKFIREEVHHGNPVFRSAEERGWTDDLILGRLLLSLLQARMDDEEIPLEERQIAETWPRTGINQVRIGGRVVTIPDNLQGPSMELSESDLDLGLYVFEQSLVYLQDYFPSARIGVLYLPSTLASYEIASPQVSVQTYHQGDRTYSGEAVWERSDHIATRIQAIAESHGIAFQDARPRIREVSAAETVHGPRDWGHYNRAGYTALGLAGVELVGKLELSVPRPSR